MSSLRSLFWRLFIVLSWRENFCHFCVETLRGLRGWMAMLTRLKLKIFICHPSFMNDILCTLLYNLLEGKRGPWPQKAPILGLHSFSPPTSRWLPSFSCLQAEIEVRQRSKEKARGAPTLLWTLSLTLSSIALFLPKSFTVFESRPKKSHSTLRAERATFTFWVDKSWLKMPQNGSFWRVFENLKLVVKQCYQIGHF